MSKIETSVITHNGKRVAHSLRICCISDNRISINKVEDTKIYEITLEGNLLDWLEIKEALRVMNERGLCLNINGEVITFIGLSYGSYQLTEDSYCFNFNAMIG